MRTTLDLPHSLIEEARLAFGFKSKTDTVVLALRELLRTRRKDDLKALLRALSALPLLYPTDETWRIIGDWQNRASPAGGRFGLGDLLIAAVTHEAGALLWSLDDDFARMARLTLIDVYEP